MFCEKCGGDIETVVCGNCNTTLLKLGPYCYLCGHVVDKEPQKQAEMETDELDLANRKLCSDGACIGVINEQGYCKVCGKPYVAES